jgi:hypothetical protein
MAVRQLEVLRRLVLSNLVGEWRIHSANWLSSLLSKYRFEMFFGLLPVAMNV